MRRIVAVLLSVPFVLVQNFSLLSQLTLPETTDVIQGLVAEADSLFMLWNK